MENNNTTPADFGTLYAKNVMMAARRFLSMGRKAYADRFVSCAVSRAQTALVCASEESIKTDIASGIKMLKNFGGK